MNGRISTEQFAALHHVHPNTVKRWCRLGWLVARKVGHGWSIDVERSERFLSLRFGNETERELVSRS